MNRPALRFANVLSLLGAIAIAILWARSYRTPGHMTYTTREARYTLRSEHGGLKLIGPPSAGTSADAAAAKQFASALRNGNVAWEYNLFHGGGQQSIEPIPLQLQNSVAAALLGRPLLSGPGPTSGRLAQFRRKLLHALDNPRQFVDAHYSLNFLEFKPPLGTGFYRNDGVVLCTFDGLRVELLPSGASRTYNDPRGLSETVSYSSAGSWRADPAQLAAIRDMWHNRLDQPLGSIPYWPLLLPTLIPPVLWLCARCRAARRRAKNLCPACGYDLRASTDRCPECGGHIETQRRRRIL